MWAVAWQMSLVLVKHLYLFSGSGFSVGMEAKVKKLVFGDLCGDSEEQFPGQELCGGKGHFRFVWGPHVPACFLQPSYEQGQGEKLVKKDKEAEFDQSTENLSTKLSVKI